MADLVDLKSSNGQSILQEVKKNGIYFQPNLLLIFEKQKGNKNCGIQSCSLLLNASHIGKQTGMKITNLLNDLPYTEEKMFKFKETLQVKSQQDITETGGLNLEEVCSILKCHGHDAELFHTSESSVDEFRSKLKDALLSRESQTGVLVNYHMGTLGQGTWFGHHSPLAAYYEQKDMVLLMDTWKETHECWVNVSDLFKAMDVTDEASGKKRGFIIFKKK